MEDSSYFLRHIMPHQQVSAMEELTAAFDLPACHQHLWMITKAFIGSEECDGLSAHDRSRYLFFYEKLEALLKEVYLSREQPPAPVVPIQPSPPAA